MHYALFSNLVNFLSKSQIVFLDKYTSTYQICWILQWRHQWHYFINKALLMISLGQTSRKWVLRNNWLTYGHKMSIKGNQINVICAIGGSILIISSKPGRFIVSFALTLYWNCHVISFPRALFQKLIQISKSIFMKRLVMK